MSELKLPHKLEQSNTSSNITSKKGFVNKFFGSDGFNFKDVLDLINPLHHIPIVGSSLPVIYLMIKLLRL